MQCIAGAALTKNRNALFSAPLLSDNQGFFNPPQTSPQANHGSLAPPHLDLPIHLRSDFPRFSFAVPNRLRLGKTMVDILKRE